MMIAFLLPVLVILVYSHFIIGCCKIEGNYLKLLSLEHFLQSIPVEDVTAGLLQMNWNRSWRGSCLENKGPASVLHLRLHIIKILIFNEPALFILRKKIQLLADIAL